MNLFLINSHLRPLVLSQLVFFLINYAILFMLVLMTFSEWNGAFTACFLPTIKELNVAKGGVD